MDATYTIIGALASPVIFLLVAIGLVQLFKDLSRG